MRAFAVPALLIVAGILAGGCGASFDPTGPCTSDGSAPGAYPDLEVKVPTQFNGAKPADLDSGRACTAAGLGTLASHGVKEMRFAGATWSTGSESGVSLAVFTDPIAPPLDSSWMAEFFETGARAGKNVQAVDPAEFAAEGGVTGHRIDVLNGESYQSVLVWQRGDTIAVALVGDAIREIQTKDAHEKMVQAALDAFGAGARR